jgi:hypothetical protein
MPIDNPYQHGYEKYSYTPIVEFKNGQRIMYPWHSQRWMSWITILFSSHSLSVAKAI